MYFIKNYNHKFNNDYIDSHGASLSQGTSDC